MEQTATGPIVIGWKLALANLHLRHAVETALCNDGLLPQRVLTVSLGLLAAVDVLGSAPGFRSTRPALCPLKPS